MYLHMMDVVDQDIHKSPYICPNFEGNLDIKKIVTKPEIGIIANEVLLGAMCSVINFTFGPRSGKFESSEDNSVSADTALTPTDGPPWGAVTAVPETTVSILGSFVLILFSAMSIAAIARK